MAERLLYRLSELVPMLGVSKQHIVQWIDSGDLRAVDVSSKPGRMRKRRMVTRAALEEFLKSRELVPHTEEGADTHG